MSHILLCIILVKDELTWLNWAASFAFQRLFLDLSQINIFVYYLLVIVAADTRRSSMVPSCDTLIAHIRSPAYRRRPLVLVYYSRWSALSNWLHHLIVLILILHRLLFLIQKCLMLEVCLLIRVIWKVIVVWLLLSVLQAVYRRHEINFWFEELLPWDLLVCCLLMLRMRCSILKSARLMVRRMMVLILFETSRCIRHIDLTFISRLFVWSHLRNLPLAVIALVKIWDIATRLFKLDLLVLLMLLLLLLRRFNLRQKTIEIVVLITYLELALMVVCVSRF